MIIENYYDKEKLRTNAAVTASCEANGRKCGLNVNFHLSSWLSRRFPEIILVLFATQRRRCCTHSLRSLTIRTTIPWMTMTSHAAGSRLKPYLTTAQLISLAALASPIISLLFILFRLSASSDSAQQSVSSAKDTLQASCLAAEHSASVGASLPRYLAQGVNEQITDGVRASIEGVRIGLTLRYYLSLLRVHYFSLI